MRSLLFLLAFSLGCQSSTAPRESLRPHIPLGVVAHRLDSAEVSELRELGVKYVRITFYASFDRSGQLAHLSQSLAALDAVGIAPLIVVHDFASADQVAPTMADLTERFPDRQWQVGNEWDFTPEHFASTGTAYAQLMQEVLTKAPRGRYVGLGLAGGDLPRWERWFASYRAAGGPRLDAYAIQVYGDVQAQVAEAKRLAGDTPLWVTEVGGLPNASGLPETQAATFSTADRIYGYCLTAGDGYGWVEGDRMHTRKTVFQWARTYNQGEK